MCTVNRIAFWLTLVANFILPENVLKSPRYFPLQEQPRKVPIGEQSGGSHHRQMVNEKVNEMEDQLITAKAYLQFAPPNSNSHLVRELKSRIKEIQRVLGHVRGSNLPRG